MVNQERESLLRLIRRLPVTPAPADPEVRRTLSTRRSAPSWAAVRALSKSLPSHSLALRDEIEDTDLIEGE